VDVGATVVADEQPLELVEPVRWFSSRLLTGAATGSGRCRSAASSIFALLTGVSSSGSTHLASRGFVVVALDHTYESEAVQFPDGWLVRRTLPENPIDPHRPTPYRLILKTIDTRISDMRFVLRKLPRINRAVEGTMDTRRVGVFGHSLGGLIAAAIAGTDATVRAGADLDGSIYGPGARNARSRPFMIMTEHGDATMAAYWSRLHRPRLFVRINGTRHLNFSDWNVLSPWLRATSRRVPRVAQSHRRVRWRLSGHTCLPSSTATSPTAKRRFSTSRHRGRRSH
jgi:pimeloyl-ACP methyl ester carboxylesterase